MSIPSEQRTRELLVPRNVFSNQTKLEHIQRLFKVLISTSRNSHSDGELISLSGNSEDIARAQEYIGAVCSPECTKEVPFDSSIGTLCENLDQIEQEFVVCTTLRDPVLILQGRGAKVDKAMTKIQEIATQELVVRRSTVVENGNDLVHTFQSLDLNQSNGVNPAPTSESNHHFMGELVRLGYNENAVRTAIKNAGPSATYDRVLSILTQSPVSWTPVEPPHECPSPQYPMAQLPMPSAKVTKPTNGLRSIVIDGSNVAISHGNSGAMRDLCNPFSCRGIQIVVQYFKERGHSHIYVFVPLWRKEHPSPTNNIIDQHILRELDQQGLIRFTPSRTINNRRVSSYDDYYIVKLAHEVDGIIVSNDNYRDVAACYPHWKDTIDKRLLMFTFVDDLFMPPEDPLGRSGPHLDDFLRLTGTHGHQRECPHGKKCTFGRHCKYSHTDRDQNQRKVCQRGANCKFGPTCKYYHPEKEEQSPAVENRGGLDSPISQEQSLSPSPAPLARVPGYQVQPNGYPSHPDLHLPLANHPVARSPMHSDSCYEMSPRASQYVPRSVSSPYMEQPLPHRVVLNNQLIYPHSTPYTYPQRSVSSYGQFPSGTSAGGLSQATPPGGNFPPRIPTQEERERLLDMLKSILPGKEELIHQIMGENPHLGERDLRLLVRLCQERCPLL